MAKRTKEEKAFLRGYEAGYEDGRHHEAALNPSGLERFDEQTGHWTACTTWDEVGQAMHGIGRWRASGLFVEMMDRKYGNR